MTAQSAVVMETIRSATIDVITEARKRRQSPMPLKELRLAAIMDTFTQACFEPGTCLGEHNVLTKRVKQACFLRPSHGLSAELLDNIFNTEILELTEPSFARGPFEFLAGAGLPLDDARMKKSILKES